MKPMHGKIVLRLGSESWWHHFYVSEFSHSWIKILLDFSVQNNKLSFLHKPVCVGSWLLSMNGVPSNTEKVCLFSLHLWNWIPSVGTVFGIDPPSPRIDSFHQHSVLSTAWLAYSWRWKTTGVEQQSLPPLPTCSYWKDGVTVWS